MLSEKRIKNIIRETIDKLISNKDYINEITIVQKYDIESKSNKTKLPFELFSQLCQLDPTTKPNKVGKYANWILAKYQPNVDLQTLKITLEWYADGIKRNILQREGVSPDINTYKSYEEFISVINSKMHSNSVQLSNAELNHREKLKGQFEIVGSTSKFEIIKPLTFDAERFFGSGTHWCTVANESYFSRYMRSSPLYIVYPKDGNSDYKMQFHEKSHSFADKDDNVYDTISECIFSCFHEDNAQANELRNLCKKIFNPESIGGTVKEKIKALNGMDKIPPYFFKECEITKLVIPDSVTEIGESAFDGCTSLTSIKLPAGLTTIGRYAFSRCKSLKSIKFPAGVTSIEWCAFSDCTSLKSIKLPDGLTTIEEEAFAGCYSLTSVTIPDSVTTIEDRAFYYCNNLKEIILPIRFRGDITRIFEGTNANIRFYGQQNESLNDNKVGGVKYRLTENDLRKIIGESINKILKEGLYDNFKQ